MLGLHAFLLGSVVVSGLAAIFDARGGAIPNALTLPAFGLAVVAHAAVEASRGGAGLLLGLGASLGGALVTSLVPLLLFRIGALGGGDVKLFAALGATLLPLLGIEAALYAFVTGALVAPARMAYEGRLGATLVNTARLALNPLLPKEKRRSLPPSMLSEMRFGPSIFVGTLAVAVTEWR